MQYGAMNFPVKPIADEIEAIARLGFDYLELAMDPPQAHYSLIRQHKSEILRLLDFHSLGLICHLPTFVYTADLTESIRKASVEEMLNSVEVAAELGAAKAVLHPSYVSGLGQFVKDMIRKYASESLERIVEKAEDEGICLCLENLFPKYDLLFEPDEFTTVFEQFPELGFTLDTGHAHIDSKDGKRVIEFIEKFGNRLAHIHISDNSGKKDDHLPIGKGTVNFPEIVRSLKKAGYDDTVTLEIFTDDRYDIKRSRERFAAMLAEIG